MNLSEKENTAIVELKQRITKFFPEAEFILFGSKAKEMPLHWEIDKDGIRL
jgi:hypothetical protein